MQIKLVVKNSGPVTQTLMFVSPNSTSLPLVKYYLRYTLAEWWLWNIYAALRETLATPSMINTLHHQNLESEPGRGIAHRDQRYQVQLCTRLWVSVACMQVIWRTYQHRRPQR